MNFWNIARPEESPVLKKTLSIMRLTTLFSIACSLQISASVYSQETKLSLDVNNQTIKEVLFRIEKQSGFRFIYESEKVNLNKKVSVHVKEQTVETILKRLFAGEGVKYEITVGSNLIKLGNNETPTGYPLNSYFGYEFDGIIQNEQELEAYKSRFSEGGIPGDLSVGDAMYKDLDGDGKLSVLGDGKEGSGDVKYLGDKNPRYNFGFNLSMAWKGFDLSAFIQGVGRRTMFLEGESRCPMPEAWYQSAEYWYGKTWTPERTDAQYPAITLKDKRNYNYYVSTNTKFNVAYARLKNLQFGYTIPQTLTSKAGLQKVRVYFSGEDLFEVHNTPNGWDPEENSGSITSYPFTRNYSFGINVVF